MKSVRIEDLEVFVYVASAHSFSDAARLLSISPVVASNAVKRLEDCLGIKLFVRNTRSLRITPEGSRNLTHAQTALRAVRDGEAEVTKENGASSRLRLSLPSDFGRNHLLTWIEEHVRHSDRVEMEVMIGDSLADLHSVPIDLTIRYGNAKDSDLIYLPIAAQNRRVLCASPAYLERHSRIESIDDLLRHDCLRFKGGGVVYSRWTFGSDAAQSSIPVNGSRITDDAELVRRWAVAGLGVAYKSELDIMDDLRAGRLVRVLPRVPGELAPLVMLAVHRSVITPGVASLVAHLKERCAAHALVSAQPNAAPDLHKSTHTL